MNIIVTDKDAGNVTLAKRDALTRVNPYYALVNGEPLPIAANRQDMIGSITRSWISRWLDVATPEQAAFCGWDGAAFVGGAEQ